MVHFSTNDGLLKAPCPLSGRAGAANGLKTPWNPMVAWCMPPQTTGTKKVDKLPSGPAMQARLSGAGVELAGLAFRAQAGTHASSSHKNAQPLASAANRAGGSPRWRGRAAARRCGWTARCRASWGIPPTAPAAWPADPRAPVQHVACGPPQRLGQDADALPGQAKAGGAFSGEFLPHHLGHRP